MAILFGVLVSLFSLLVMQHNPCQLFCILKFIKSIQIKLIGQRELAQAFFGLVTILLKKYCSQSCSIGGGRSNLGVTIDKPIRYTRIPEYCQSTHYWCSIGICETFTVRPAFFTRSRCIVSPFTTVLVPFRNV